MHGDFCLLSSNHGKENTQVHTVRYTSSLDWSSTQPTNPEWQRKSSQPVTDTITWLVIIHRGLLKQDIISINVRTPCMDNCCPAAWVQQCRFRCHCRGAHPCKASEAPSSGLGEPRAPSPSPPRLASPPPFASRPPAYAALLHPLSVSLSLSRAPSCDRATSIMKRE